MLVCIIGSAPPYDVGLAPTEVLLRSVDKQKKTATELEEIVKQRIGAGDFKVTIHSGSGNRLARHDLRTSTRGSPPLPSNGGYDRGRVEPALRASRLASRHRM